MRLPFFWFWRRLAATVGLGLPAIVAQAQATTNLMPLLGNDPAVTAYTGPRYPGGPDSLRATLRRHLRTASPALVGQLFLHLELDSAGRSREAYFLAPPAGSPSRALYTNPEAQHLARQLVPRRLPWQVRQLVPGPLPSPASSVTIPLNFGPEPQPVALAYGDELPLVFGGAARGAGPAAGCSAAQPGRVYRPAGALSGR